MYLHSRYIPPSTFNAKRIQDCVIGKGRSDLAVQHLDHSLWSPSRRPDTTKREGHAEATTAKQEWLLKVLERAIGQRMAKVRLKRPAHPERRIHVRLEERHAVAPPLFWAI